MCPQASDTTRGWRDKGKRKMFMALGLHAALCVSMLSSRSRDIKIYEYSSVALKFGPSRAYVPGPYRPSARSILPWWGLLSEGEIGAVARSVGFFGKGGGEFGGSQLSWRRAVTPSPATRNNRARPREEKFCCPF